MDGNSGQSVEIGLFRLWLIYSRSVFLQSAFWYLFLLSQFVLNGIKFTMILF